MKLLLNLAGVLTFLVGITAFLSFKLDNMGIAIFCLVLSAIAFTLGAKHDQD
jgi:hypothetical protein